MRVYRERTTVIRWRGDPLTEVAAVAALNYPNMLEAEQGLCVRSLRVPREKVGLVKLAIRQHGGRLVEA